MSAPRPQFTADNVIPFPPSRAQDDNLLRVIAAFERSGIAVVSPDEHEDDAIERTLRALPVSPELERLAAKVGTRTEAEARALHPVFEIALEAWRP